MAVEKKTTHSYYPTQVGKKETIKVCKTSINLELSMKNYFKKNECSNQEKAVENIVWLTPRGLIR